MNGRKIARLAFLAGALALGAYFLSAAPRDVTLVYAVRDRAASGLEVELLRDAAPLRRAEFRLTAGAPGEVAQRVRLPDGTYRLRLTLTGGGPARQLERTITVSESGTIVLPVGG